MSVKFEDNHIRIKADMKSEAVAFLHEAAGALVSQTQRNTAVGKVSGGKTKSEWTYQVDESKLEAWNRRICIEWRWPQSKMVYTYW